MTLFQLYKKIIMYPVFFLLPVAAVISFLLWNTEANHDLSFGTIFSIYALAVAVYTVVIAILSLTIFLNKIETVRSNLLLSLLSWFFFPGGFVVFMAVNALRELSLGDNTYEPIYKLIFIAPFGIMLIWSFMKFKKNQLV